MSSMFPLPLPMKRHLSEKSFYVAIVLAGLIGMLAIACTADITPVATPLLPTAAASSPTPAASPTSTPTPLPAILQQPLRRVDAPNGAFSLQAPQSWQESPITGGLEFHDATEKVRFSALVDALTAGSDPVLQVSNIISETLIAAQEVEPGAFALLRKEVPTPDHYLIEYLARLQPEHPLTHARVEVWAGEHALVGLSLAADEDAWPAVAPIWDSLRQSFQLHDLTPILQNTFTAYAHPSGVFTTTLPANWGIIDEGDDAVVFGDEDGYAQYAIGITAYDHRPGENELQAALDAYLADVAQSDTYVELANESPARFERMIRFEVLSSDGFYRTELRAFSAANYLFMTSFSAPPHDWERYLPDYDHMRQQLTLLAPPPPSEAEQDADPTAGIYAEDVMYYRAGGGALWVSAPIRNNRTRNLSRLTAAVQLFAADGALIGAESWMMPQRILAAGRITYLTQRITPDVLALDKVADVQIAIVDAQDTTKDAPPSWAYVGGDARLNDKGNIILNITMRNTASYARKRIYAVAIIYNNRGQTIFARGETQKLPYAVPADETVDLELTVWGPLPDVSSFDVVGEEPR